MKRKFLLFTAFLLFQLSGPPLISQIVPLVVFDAEKVWDDFGKFIGRSMPHGIEILLYPPYLINLNQKEQKNVQNKFQKTIQKAAQSTGYKMITPDQIQTENTEIKETLNHYPGQKEIMTAAKLLKYDAVLIVNITKTNGDFRNVWSQKNKSIVRKEIFHLQANLYNPENDSVYLRLSYFFFFDF